MKAKLVSLSSTDNQQRFYRAVLEFLNEGGFHYLVGGGHALEQYAGALRVSKDLDLFVRRADLSSLLEWLSDKGFLTEFSFPHWLAKVFSGRDFIDIIFSSGNGVCAVDDSWFEHSVPGETLGMKVNLCPAEELIWSKTFVMERERYDGADVAHVIRARGDRLDWPRLLRRFETHWHVLLSHLILFRFHLSVGTIRDSRMVNSRSPPAARSGASATASEKSRLSGHALVALTVPHRR
jgi:hypothetical protein